MVVTHIETPFSFEIQCCYRNFRKRSHESVLVRFNRNICACKCGEDCDISEYLKDCLIESVGVSRRNKINYWLIANSFIINRPFSR